MHVHSENLLYLFHFSYSLPLSVLPWVFECVLLFIDTVVQWIGTKERHSVWLLISKHSDVGSHDH